MSCTGVERVMSPVAFATERAFAPFALTRRPSLSSVAFMTRRVPAKVLTSVALDALKARAATGPVAEMAPAAVRLRVGLAGFEV